MSNTDRLFIKMIIFSKMSFCLQTSQMPTVIKIDLYQTYTLTHHTHLHTISKMSADEMSANEMSVDNMSANNMSVNKRPLDKL